MSIQLINGLCGSGKTRTAIEQIASHPNNKHLFVVPAIELANELVTNYLTHFDAVTIHSENSKNTTYNITQHMTTHDTGSKHVLVITHASFRLMDISKAEGWKVWHDEVPEATQELRIFFDQNVAFDTYFNVAVDGSVTLTKVATKTDHHDALNEELKALIYSLKTGRFEAVLLSKGEDSYGKRWMEVLTHITPSFFPTDTTIMGANIESKIAFSILDGAGVAAEVWTIPGEVENHYSDKIRIVYAMENYNTKSLRENHAEAYQNALQALVASVPDEPCLAVSNSDVKLDKTRFKLLTHNVHGMNGFTHYNNVLFQSSLNVSNTTQSVLEERWGITTDDVYMDRTVDTAYQVIMRGALRLETPVVEFNIFVMDRRLADTLKERFFPNATVVGLKGYNIRTKKRGRPVKKEPLTDMQRRKLCNMRKLAKGGYYAGMTNFRILNNESRVVMGMDIWVQTDTRGKLVS